MDQGAVAGFSRLLAIVGVLVGAGVVFVVARWLARRAEKGQRTVVSLSSRE